MQDADLFLLVNLVPQSHCCIEHWSYFLEMDNNFKFKTRHVSIVQRSSSVVNSFVSSVELIQAMTYKLKRHTNQDFEKFLILSVVLAQVLFHVSRILKLYVNFSKSWGQPIFTRKVFSLGFVLKVRVFKTRKACQHLYWSGEVISRLKCFDNNPSAWKLAAPFF